MADISQVQVGSTTYDVHDATARTDVSNEIARAKKAESDEYTRATTAEAALRDSVSQNKASSLKYTALWLTNNLTVNTSGRTFSITWPVDFDRIKYVGCSYVGVETNAVLVVSNWKSDSVELRSTVNQEYNIVLSILYV